MLAAIVNQIYAYFIDILVVSPKVCLAKKVWEANNNNKTAGVILLIVVLEIALMTQRFTYDTFQQSLVKPFQHLSPLITP